MKHIVGFSGGIDSQAAANVVLEIYGSEDVILLNSTAGRNEHPLTVEFVEWFSTHVHPVIVVDPIVSDLWNYGRTHVSQAVAESKGYSAEQVLDFGDMIVLKGLGPSSQAQFCTDILKLRPQRRWIEQNLQGIEYERYTGVRRDESRKRKDTPLREWDDFYDCWLNNIIADWTKDKCFELAKSKGQEINALYRMGFSRVGCAPCVNANKEDVSIWATRFPEMIDKVRAWEKKSGRTFFPPLVPGMVMNFVDDVVRWSLTSRGGRQDVFPIFHERQACESKYGLCE